MENHIMRTTTTVAMDLILSNFVRTQERSGLEIVEAVQTTTLAYGINAPFEARVRPWWKFL